ncbi:MAG TPA: response regulator [Stellaceae bacterium]|nr:response regulator [Stellaceae bacterium]
MPHVLVVEDYDGLGELLRAAFEARAAFRVSSAARPEEAMRVLDRDPPDIALIDVCLPGSSGIELAWCATNRRVPVLMMTGDPEAEMRFEGAGVPYLRKPFRLSELEAAVGAVLASRSDHLARMRARLSLLFAVAEGGAREKGSDGTALGATEPRGGAH